jgi:hypothetical protein
VQDLHDLPLAATEILGGGSLSHVCASRWRSDGRKAPLLC